ncbi:MAG: hypothetical protein ACOYLO_17205 [Ferruginibacter sp.]
MNDAFIEIRDGLLSIQAPGIREKKQDLIKLLKKALEALEGEKPYFEAKNELIYEQ